MAIPVEVCEPNRSAAIRQHVLFRYSSSDALLVIAALLQACALLAAFAWLTQSGAAGRALTAILFGLGVCWCSNTVAHIHLHKPLFRARALNRALSLFLGVLIGVPQSVWRARHLWHHAGEPSDRRPKLWRTESLVEALPILGLWCCLLGFSADTFWFVYTPGFLLGMSLCQLQGRMEHALDRCPERGVSHYGPLHNLLWFNDGYHAEHHQWPSEHWARLPARRADLSSASSEFPPLLRALEIAQRRTELVRPTALGWLEGVALRSARLQHFMLKTHEVAFLRLLPASARIQKIGIIGGGLFPRTLIVLGRMFPASQLVVIDGSVANVTTAREYLAAHGPWTFEHVSFVTDTFSPARHADFDLVVAPLAFVGDRAELVRVRPRFGLVTHDWIWRVAGRRGAVISWLLLKRLNLFSEPS